MWSKVKTFVRNPFDRAVSTYFFNKSGGHGATLELTKLLKTQYPTFESWVLQNGIETHMNQSIAHCEQYHWLVDSAGHPIVKPENIGRFETLEADFVSFFVENSEHRHTFSLLIKISNSDDYLVASMSCLESTRANICLGKRTIRILS